MLISEKNIEKSPTKTARSLTAVCQTLSEEPGHSSDILRRIAAKNLCIFYVRYRIIQKI